VIALILACSILLSFVIDLNLWQGIVVVLFVGSVWVTGRRISDEGKGNR
jgi:hypothetical protein